MLRISAITACVLAGLSGMAVSQEGPIGTSGGPDIPFRGCIAFQHRDFHGARLTLRGNVNVKYTGDNWNDQISSFACATGCNMTIFEHRDFQGARVTWGTVSYVGSRWNDRVSSLFVRCTRSGRR
jgi:hypothetical protein